MKWDKKKSEFASNFALVVVLLICYIIGCYIVFCNIEEKDIHNTDIENKYAVRIVVSMAIGILIGIVVMVAYSVAAALLIWVIPWHALIKRMGYPKLAICGYVDSENTNGCRFVKYEFTDKLVVNGATEITVVFEYHHAFFIFVGPVCLNVVYLDKIDLEEGKLW